MAAIFTRAPLRISLGGGGTDLPSYYSQHGGFLVAGAIDKYVYLLTHAAFQERYLLKYSKFERVDHPREIEHNIFRETILRHWDCEGGEPLEIATVADVPQGTGLGSSGAFTVGLIKSLAMVRHRSITPGELAEQASEIEIDVLGEPVGKQDQYVSAHGGICAYTFHRNGRVEVEPLDISDETLARLRNHLLLFYTGKAHEAAKILGNQDERTRAGDDEMIENLHATKEMGLRSRVLLESGDLEGFAALMDEHWQTKRRRSPNMTDDEIDDLYTLAKNSGCIGGKLVGAGGGGFLLLYAPDPQATRRALQHPRRKLTELPFDFEFRGAFGSESA